MAKLVTLRIMGNVSYVRQHENKSKIIKCRIIKEYPHFYLVERERNGIKECFLKADFITHDIQVLS